MIDARGRSCPEPVIMLKKALTSNENAYTIIVDNRTSLENVTRFANYSGFQVDYTEKDEEYTIQLKR